MDVESVLAYLRAVGDELPIYRESGLAPPLYAVAVALGQILQRCSLPAGAIHSLQEYEQSRPIALGSRLSTAAWLDRQRERGGMRFLTFGVSAGDEEGRNVLAIKTTLLVPGPTDDRLESGRPAASPPADRATSPAPDGLLPTVSRRITQQQLVDYSAVSGDHNPLHLDPDFAAGTRFGGVIAHGMLTLAFIGEMLTACLGERWLTNGALRARFKGAAYLEDPVETWGRPASPEGATQNITFGIINADTCEELITGSATVPEI